MSSFVAGGGIQSQSVSRFDPITLGGCVLWLDAADSNTLYNEFTNDFPSSIGTRLATVGDNVVLWSDKSGQANNATQNIQANIGLFPTQPIGIPATFVSNTNNTLRFGNLGSFRLNPQKMPTDKSPTSIFVVAKLQDASSPTTLLHIGDYVAASRFIRLSTTLGPTFGQGSDGIYPNANNATLSFQNTIVTGIVSGGTSTDNNFIYTGWANGAPFSSNTPSDRMNLNLSVETVYAGIAGASSSGVQGFKGDISEILMFNRALQNDERQQVEGYLAWKWGLVQNLPVTHPYYYSKAPQSAFQPTNFPSCALWLDAADSGSIPRAVSQWTDKSGNGRHFVAAGSSPTPTFLPTAFLRRPGIQFTRTSNTSRSILEWTNGATPLVTSDITVTMLVKRLAITTVQDRLLSTTSSLNTLDSNKADAFAFVNAYASKKLVFRNNNNIFTDPVISALINGESEIVTMTINKSTLTSTIRKTISTGTTTGTRTGEADSVLNLKQIRLGTLTNIQEGSTDAGASTFEGVISEVLIYNNVLPPAQLENLEGYLAWKYNSVPMLLPSSHPYFAAAPINVIPNQISGCQLWLDAADSATVVATNVTQWNDKSGNGANAAQATSANRPTYSNNAITFNGTSSFLSIPGSGLDIASEDFSIFAVFNYLAASNNPLPIIGKNAGAAVPEFRLAFDTNKSAQISYHNPSNIQASSSVTFTTTGRLLMNGSVSRSSSMQVFLNGGSTLGPVTSTTSATGSLSATSVDVLIGRGWITPNRFFDSDMYEIILYKGSALTTAQRQQIEGYLAWKWNLQSNLPSTHPFTQANYFFNNTRPFSRKFSPPDIEGCQLWIDAADASTVTLTSSRVTTVKDKSGLGNNVSNSSSILTYSDTLNGLNTITCPGGADGTTNNLTISGVTRDRFNHSYFVVCKYPSANAVVTRMLNMTNHSFGHSFSTWLLLDDNNTNAQLQSTQYAGTDATENAALAGNAYICAAVRQNSIYTIVPNGITTELTTNSDGTTIGATLGNSPTTAYLITPPLNSGANVGGQLAEVIVYNRALPTYERQIVEGYLAWKWGFATRGINREMSENLFPTTHPYALYSPISTTILPSAKLYKKTFVPADLSPVLWFDPQDSATYATNANNRLTSWTSKGSNKLQLGTIDNVNGPLITTSGTLASGTAVSQGAGFQFADFSSGGYFQITGAELTSSTVLRLTLTPNHNIPPTRQVTFSQLAGTTAGGTSLSTALTNGSYIIASATPSTINITLPTTQGSTGTFSGVNGAVEYGNISIASASTTVDKLTINTTQAHGLSTGDLVTVNFTAGTLPTSGSAATAINNAYTATKINDSQITVPLVSLNTEAITGAVGVLIFPSAGCGLNWTGAAVTSSAGGTLVCVTHLPRTPVRNSTLRNSFLSASTTIGNAAGAATGSNGTDFKLTLDNTGAAIRKNNGITASIGNTQLTAGFNVMNATFSNTTLAGTDITTGANGLAVKGWRYDTALSNTNFNSTSAVAASSTLSLAQIRLGGNTDATNSSPHHSHWYEGGLGDVFFFNRVLTLQERQLLEGWLSEKYGCNNTLGATSISTGGAGAGSSVHPYRLNPATVTGQNTLGTPITSQTQISNNLAAWFDAAYSPTLSTSKTSFTNTLIPNGTAIDAWGSRAGSWSQAITGAGWVTHTVPARRPLYVTNSVNGLPGLRFSKAGGTADSALDAVIGIGRIEYTTITQDAHPNTTIIAVIKPIVSSNGIIVNVGQTAPNISVVLEYRIDSKISFSVNSGTPQTIISDALTNGNAYIVVARRRGTEMLLKTIGSGGTTKTSTVVAYSLIGGTTAYLRVGNSYSEGTSPFQGDINEFMIFRSGLTDQSIQQIEGYLAWKWGLQGSLPDTHAYKRVYT